MRRRLLTIIIVLAVFVLGLTALSRREIPEKISYGVSFSKLHAEELGLNWQEVYTAFLDDLGARQIRLSAHWPMVEPKNGEYNFSELDYQTEEAKKRGAEIILAVGGRLPGWPECHTPDWAIGLTKEEREREITEYLGKTVSRYKNLPNLRYFQVENEPFLRFAEEYCPKVDEDFLVREIALVKSLDPAHPVLVTDSGEMGLWYKARREGDVFGTSVYLYVWHHALGPLRYPIGPGFFRLKQNILDFISGPKQTILIELGAEPWLTRPIVDSPLELQFSRMGFDKWQEVIDFNKKSGFAEQYLWGAEWWYWLKSKNHPEFWEAAKKLFAEN